MRGGYRHEASGLLVGGEQFFDFLLQLVIAAACLGEEVASRNSVLLECSVEDPLHFLPMLGRHPCTPPVSSEPPCGLSRRTRLDINASVASEEARANRPAWATRKGRVRARR